MKHKMLLFLVKQTPLFAISYLFVPPSINCKAFMAPSWIDLQIIHVHTCMHVCCYMYDCDASYCKNSPKRIFEELGLCAAVLHVTFASCYCWICTAAKVLRASFNHWPVLFRDKNGDLSERSFDLVQNNSDKMWFYVMTF